MVVALLLILLAGVAVTKTNGKRVRELLPHRDVRKFGEPSQLLGSSEDLVLLLVSEQSWIRSNWKCMKSKFVSTVSHNKTFVRQEVYWIPPVWFSNQTKPKAGKLTFLYDVLRQPGEYTKVNTTLLGTSANYSFGEYPVLFADNSCMVIQFPKTPSYIFKNPRCALWVLNTTLCSPEMYRHCIFIMLSSCKTPLYNLYEYERNDCDKWGDPPEPESVTTTT
uniref:Putative conserved secreted protein n=1 Tax=Hyalomma excavatum TaxID=257692 RepID=A0A131XFY1_9ACAR